MKNNCAQLVAWQTYNIDPSFVLMNKTMTNIKVY